MRSINMIAFCGHGRSGKDTAAYAFSKITGLRYAGSMSWLNKSVVAKALDLPEQTAWETRHQRRMDWYNILNDYRKEDPAKLIRESMGFGQVISGIGDFCELQAGVSEGLIKFSIWIHRPGIENDPTVTYTSSHCTHSLANDGDLFLLESRLKELAEELGLL